MSEKSSMAGDVREMIRLSWTLMLLRGIIAILFGIIAIAAPASTAVSLAVVWGIWALFDGIGLIIGAFTLKTGFWGRLGLLLMAVIALLAAFIAIFRPGVTAVTLTWILGIWLIARGLFEFIGAFADNQTRSRLMVALIGVLDVVLGFIFVANPGRAAVGLAVTLGILALIWGVFSLFAAFSLKGAAKEHAAG